MMFPLIIEEMIAHSNETRKFYFEKEYPTCTRKYCLTDEVIAFQSKYSTVTHEEPALVFSTPCDDILCTFQNGISVRNTIVADEI